jgi:hypothetical protein
MQYKRLNPGQKRILAWRGRRNRLVDELLAADRHLSREEALKKANRQLRKR